MRNKDKSISELYDIGLSYQVTKATDSSLDIPYSSKWYGTDYIANTLDVHFHDNDDTGNFPASHGGQQGAIVIRQCDIGKFVQHESHMDRKPATAVKICLIIKFLKDLCVEKPNDKVVGFV